MQESALKNIKKAVLEPDFFNSNLQNAKEVDSIKAHIQNEWETEHDSITRDYFEGDFKSDLAPSNYIEYWLNNKDLVKLGYDIEHIESLVWN